MLTVHLLLNKMEKLVSELHLHHYNVDTSNTNADSSADDLFIENMTPIGSGTSGTGTIYFGDSGDNSAGRLNYYQDNSMRMFTA
jgi:hypothetical protein